MLSEIFLGIVQKDTVGQLLSSNILSELVQSCPKT